MIAFTAQDLADLRRWAISGAIVVAAYGGVAVAMVSWHDPSEGTDAAAGLVIELAPVPIAPELLAAAIGPQQTIDSPEVKERIEQKREAELEQKEQLEAKPVEEPPPEVAPALNPELAVPPPPPRQEVKQEVQPQQPQLAAIAATPVVSEQTGAIPAAPRQGAPNPYDSAAARTWQAKILALIQRNKRYPPAARSRGEQGTPQVVFTLDRQGHVVESRIARSSGVAALDEEAVALLQRAQPFPAPPPEIPDARVPVTVQLRFNLR